MVDTDPHAQKAQLDDPHVNPNYDPDEDGLIERLADHDHSGPGDGGDQLNLGGADSYLDAPLIIESGGTGDNEAIILVPTTGEDKAQLRWLFSDVDERLGVINCDENDPEMSFYTASSDGGSGDDQQKRLDIEGGSDANFIGIKKTTPDSDTKLSFDRDDGESKYQIWHRGANGDLRINQSVLNEPVLDITDDGSTPIIDFIDTPLSGLRELTNADPSDLFAQEWAFDADRDGSGNPAWLFKDSTGTVHYWDADGTL